MEGNAQMADPKESTQSKQKLVHYHYY